MRPETLPHDAVNPPAPLLSPVNVWSWVSGYQLKVPLPASLVQVPETTIGWALPPSGLAETNPVMVTPELDMPTTCPRVCVSVTEVGPASPCQSVQLLLRPQPVGSKP